MSSGNSKGTVESRGLSHAMAAFDGLPAPVRAAIRSARLQYSPEEIVDLMGYGMDEMDVIRAIRERDRTSATQIYKRDHPDHPLYRKGIRK